MTPTFYTPLLTRLLALGCKRASVWRGQTQDLQDFPAAYVEAESQQARSYGNRTTHELRVTVRLHFQHLGNEDAMQTPYGTTPDTLHTDRLDVLTFVEQVRNGLQGWAHAPGQLLNCTGQDHYDEPGQYLVYTLTCETLLVTCPPTA